ncbi:helix-turn-helix domain-containing protein [Pseudaeromonas sp. ZJS20]|uniref:helix-turn-helix domain-containing protein n=1 Tax=Pseudaeromonas aegiceratis TaxID=3153928 RepID=UPI00390C6D1D
MNITSAKQLSAYLRDVRLAQKRSQGKVAERGGIRQDTVSSFELNPDATKLETLFKILAALDLSLDIKPRSESDDGSAASWPEEW